MKYLVIFVLLFLFSCTSGGDAEYHLKEAMRKDSSMMVIQVDSNNRYVIPELQEKEPIWFYRDTLVTDSVIIKAQVRGDTVSFDIWIDEFGMYFW